MWRKWFQRNRQDYYQKDQIDFVPPRRGQSFAWVPLLLIPLLLIPLLVFGIAKMGNNDGITSKNSDTFQSSRTVSSGDNPQVGIGGAPVVLTPTPTVVAPVPPEDRVIQGVGGSGTVPDRAPVTGRGENIME